MPQPAIKTFALTKDYSLGIRGVKLRAVADLSIEVFDNEIFGLLGPNGSGKSTSLKIILGLLKPTCGHCEIFGLSTSCRQVRAAVGFLPEAPYFYRYLTGRELVRFYGKICGVSKREIDDRVDTVLDLLDMKEASHRRLGTYSKGMLQRIGLAQALVHDPKLVILDEPTAGVDPIGSAVIVDLILELKRRGKTILLCSHILAQVEGICDRIAILNRGKLILEGAVSDLSKDTEHKLLRVANYRASLLGPLKAFLAERGASLVGVENPHRTLDRVFLQHVVGEKGEKEGGA